MNISSLVKFIDRMALTLGNLISWVCLLLVITVFSTVVLRYLFKEPSIMLQESAMWFHSLIFMLGIAYTFNRDEHVRVDIFYRKFSFIKQQWVDLLGIIFLLMPLCWYLFSESLHYVSLSWRVREASSEVGGLPGLYILKSLLLVMPILLAVQGLANILRIIDRLRNPDNHANSTHPHQEAL